MSRTAVLLPVPAIPITLISCTLVAIDGAIEMISSELSLRDPYDLLESAEIRHSWNLRSRSEWKGI